MRTYDFSPMFRYSVGFDRMQRLLETATARSEASYPPYNIETNNDDAYRISVAVAGFEMKELDVVVENETLTISGVKTNPKESENFMHRGIAARNFQLQFNLADYIIINGANLENGLLVIDLQREVPEELKPRKIEIKTNKIKTLAERAKNLIGSEKEAA